MVSGPGSDQGPAEAFASWFNRLASDIRVKHGLGDALNTVAAQHIISQTYPPVTGAIAKLLAAGAADGSFRSALDPADVLILMGFLWRVPTRPRVGRWPLGCSKSCWRAFVRSGC